MLNLWCWSFKLNCKPGIFRNQNKDEEAWGMMRKDKEGWGRLKKDEEGWGSMRKDEEVYGRMWKDILKVFVNVIFVYRSNTSVCRVHWRLIQSGFSHVFVVYSEPIEIVWRYNNYLSIYLIIQLEIWILQSTLSVTGHIYILLLKL